MSCNPFLRSSLDPGDSFGRYEIINRTSEHASCFVTMVGAPRSSEGTPRHNDTADHLQTNSEVAFPVFTGEIRTYDTSSDTTDANHATIQNS